MVNLGALLAHMTHAAAVSAVIGQAQMFFENNGAYSMYIVGLGDASARIHVLSSF